MKVGNIVEPILEIVIGLALFPIITGFIVYAMNDPNTTILTGMNIILPIIGYAVAFGLVMKGATGLKK